MQPECLGQKATVRNFLDRYTGRIYTPVAVEQSRIIYLPNTLINLCQFKKNICGDAYVDDDNMMNDILNVNITIVTFNKKTLTAEFSTHTKASSVAITFKPIHILALSMHRS